MNDLFNEFSDEPIRNPASVQGMIGSTKRIAAMDERDDIVRTPIWFIDWMIDRIGDCNIDRVLDPCAGDNRMIGRIYERGIGNGYSAYDINNDNQIPVPFCTYQYGRDFLTTSPPTVPFDLIVMNPPFSDLGVWQFIKHCFNGWLALHGRVFCIVPNYFLDNSERRKPWLNKHVQWIWIIPKNTFAPHTPVLHGSLIELRHKITHDGFWVVPKETPDLLEH